MAVAGYKLKINGGALVDSIIDVGNVLTHDFTGLDPDTAYSIQVSAYNDVPNESAYSGAMVASTDPTPPAVIGLISFATANSEGGLTTSVTGVIDTTGADFLIIGVAYSDVGHGVIVTGDISDSKSNTWTALTAYETTGGTKGFRFFYSANATVGSGHTFSCNTNPDGTYNAIIAAAFSNVKLAAPADLESGDGSNSTTTQQPGSITPSENGELVVTGAKFLDFGLAGDASIDSGFTLIDSLSSASVNGVALAYKVQTTAAAVNPTWTKPGGADVMVAAMASFKKA